MKRKPNKISATDPGEPFYDYYFFGPYQTDKEWEESTDVLQRGDEFQEPLHYRTKGAGVEWGTILDKRVGGKPCKECRYRRKVK